MKPNKLKPNCIIGVCAPSGMIKERNNKELETARKYLEELNIKVKYSKNLYANSCVYSASVEEKTEDINELIRDESVSAIAFAKGGNNANSLLDLINYEDIKNNPKIFFGFSDNTILLNAIYKKTGLITYHYTNYKGLFEKEVNFNRQQFIDAFMKGYKGVLKQNTEWISIRKGIANGKLIGGNLGTLVKLLNTKYCPSFKNNILFIEDLAYEDCVEQVSSLLYQLKTNKVFEQISGLLIGNYDTKEVVTIESIVEEVTKEYNFPIVKCNDFGHTNTNSVLPIGIKCTLDADKCELIFNEKTIK